MLCNVISLQRLDFMPVQKNCSSILQRDCFSSVRNHSEQTMSRGTKSCAVMDSMSSLHSAAEMQCRRDDERIPEHIVTEQVLVHNSDLPQKPSDFSEFHLVNCISRPLLMQIQFGSIQSSCLPLTYINIS